MQSRVRVLGEQLNPLLTVLPLAILGSAVLFDIGGLASGLLFFARVALWDMAAGLLAGLVAVGALLIDLIAAPARTTARRLLVAETATAGGMVAIFGVVWAIRIDGQLASTLVPVLVEAFAFVTGVVGAWLARGIVVGDGLPEAGPALPRAYYPAYAAPRRDSGQTLSHAFVGASAVAMAAVTRAAQASVGIWRGRLFRR